MHKEMLGAGQKPVACQVLASTVQVGNQASFEQQAALGCKRSILNCLLDGWQLNKLSNGLMRFKVSGRGRKWERLRLPGCGL